jgi:hypothetical protein
MATSPMGGAAAASPEGVSPEGSGAVDGGPGGANKRRLSGSLRRLRSALQDFAASLSASNGAVAGGARP